MSLRAPDSTQDTIARLEAAIRAQLPGAQVEVIPTQPGHFEIRVVSERFRDRSMLEQHQLVYGAVAGLMRGDTAPVHAVDRLETRLPS